MTHFMVITTSSMMIMMMTELFTFLSSHVYYHYHPIREMKNGVAVIPLIIVLITFHLCDNDFAATALLAAAAVVSFVVRVIHLSSS